MSLTFVIRLHETHMEVLLLLFYILAFHRSYFLLLLLLKLNRVLLQFFSRVCPTIRLCI